MTAAPATSEDGIFDASKYDLPIPRLDGHKADKLVLSFSGQIELDRTSEDDLAFIDGLFLGRDVELKVKATIAKKGFTFTAREDEESAGYGVGLKIHSLTE